MVLKKTLLYVFMAWLYGITLCNENPDRTLT